MGIKKDLTLTSPVILALGILSAALSIFGDEELFVAINQGMANPVLDVLCAYGIPAVFAVYFTASLAALLLLGKENSRTVVRAGVAVALISGPTSYSLGRALKMVFGRPRPFEILPTRIVGPWHASPYSFPSTTTMLAFGFALPILFERPRLGAPLVVLAALMGFSVVYTGFHYPSDVLAGTVLSILITVSMHRLKTPLTHLLARFNL
ncbi:MAG: hypothetical protein AYL32_009380 [Candidatus Bathyarchaeota archaeon B26-2]|nr:MAG: hypothetical protein AYL32_009380 [Candidatus Bathyarchaeota archaeon B26-2]